MTGTTEGTGSAQMPDMSAKRKPGILSDSRELLSVACRSQGGIVRKGCKPSHRERVLQSKMQELPRSPMQELQVSVGSCVPNQAEKQLLANRLQGVTTVLGSRKSPLKQQKQSQGGSCS